MILEFVRSVIGEPDFYHSMTGTSNPTWDYGAILEYSFSFVLLLFSLFWVYRLMLYIVNLIRGKGARKI